MEYQVYPYTEQTKGLGIGDDNIYSNGEYHVLHGFLQRDSVIFDVGASSGRWTQIALCIMVPKFIYCFEPVPDAFLAAYQLFALRNNVEVLNNIIGNECGKTAFYWYKNNPQLAEMSNLFGRPNVEAANSIEKEIIYVDGITIDYFCKERKIKHIDYLKIDVEGAEFRVIDGAKEMMEKQTIDYIQFEYGGCFIDARTTLKETVGLLKNNYALFRIVPSGLLHMSEWIDEMENYLHSNYLAISTKIENRFPIMEFSEKDNE